MSYELKLTEAVARGILPVPIYICASYLFGEDYERLEEKISKIKDPKQRKEYEQKLEQARRNLSEAAGMKEIFKKYMKEENGKWIVFCKDIAHMEEIEALCEEWFGEVNPNQTILKISSGEERQDNIEAMQFLRRKENEDLLIALTVNMINESFHDGELSGVIMARPTKSEILYLQQLGRALMKDGKSPIIFDLVNNLKYFQEFRKEIEEIIRRGREDGKEDLYDDGVLEQFKVFSEQMKFAEEFKKLEANLDEMHGKSTIKRLLDISEKLAGVGVDFSNLQLRENYKYKTIKDILKEQEIREKLKEQGIDEAVLEEFDLDYEIGSAIMRLRAAYAGRRNI
ncbi:MAG: hypothetical protein FWC79_05540 [Oscillospiraceae bacterium]|nr:hypothetical protein [Oscillospiraceae bacterium]